MEKVWTTQWAKKDPQSMVRGCEKSPVWFWTKRYVKLPARVLEAGCGLGQWVRFLADHGYEAHGLDFSEEAIRAAQSVWPDLPLLCGDLRYIPYEDNSFDAIISLGVIEHDIEGPQEALGEMRRVLAPDGFLLSSVPCINYLRRLGGPLLIDWVVCNPTIRRLTGRQPDAAFFEYMWSPQEYRRILEVAGFEVLRLLPITLNLQRLFTGRPGDVRYRFVQWLHRRVPGLLGHMIMAICRKR